MNNKNLTGKYGAGLLVIMLVISGVAVWTKPAKADPHATFYTAIGQQQLFFNVLAALDQADYVETALDREKKRSAREQVSAKQPFAKETESGGRFTEKTEIDQDQTSKYSQGQTKPGTPALLNRQVTLEGADLYTDQLVRQFGAESARRNAAAELLQTLCEYGYGFKWCDNDNSQKTVIQKHIAQQQRQAAAITDPLAWSQMPFTNGLLAALNSGNSTPNIANPDPRNLNPVTGEVAPLLTDEEYRIGKWLWPSVYGWEPLAYSKTIAKWRNQGTDVSFLLDLYLNDILSPPDDINPFMDIATDQQGNFYSRCFAKDQYGRIFVDQSCGVNPALRYADYKLMAAWGAISAANTIDREGKAAMARIAAQQDIIENDGVLADTSLQANVLEECSDGIDNDHDGLIDTFDQECYSATDDSESLAGMQPALSLVGELTTEIKNPVAVREASIYGIPNVLGQLATSQQASSLTGLDVPGSVQLVKRLAATSGNQQPECSNGKNDDNDNYIDYPDDPECVSASDNSESQPGAQSLVEENGPQVAGALDLLFNSARNDYDRPKEPTSPSANIISPILEFGARHALRVMTAGSWRPGRRGITCGYTCD